MNRNRIPYICLIALAATASLAAAVLLFFAQTVGYDLSIQHFAKNSPYALGGAVCIGIALLAGIVAGILRAHADKNPVRHNLPAAGVFAAACTAFMMLVSFIVSIRALSTGLPILEIVKLVLMALSAAYFFLAAAKESKTGGGFALLSLCPMLYAVVSLLLVYFDKTYAMNSPLKSYQLLLYISMALFFSAEAHGIIHRPVPFRYTFFGTCCLAFAAALGLSQIVIAFHDTVGHGFSVLECAIRIAVAVYVAVRLFAASAAPAQEDSDG